MATTHSLILRAACPPGLSSTNLTGPSPGAPCAKGTGPHFERTGETNMLGYTKIQIMGNLGGTPEMKFLQRRRPRRQLLGGCEPPVQRSRGAIRRRPRIGSEFAPSNGVGEACAKHLQKGDGIFVEGPIAGASVRFEADGQGSLGGDHPQHCPVSGLGACRECRTAGVPESRVP